MQRYRRRYEVPGQVPLLVADKSCARCGESKSITQFGYSKQSRGEVNPVCKVCEAERSRVYMSGHRDIVLATKRRYREADPARHHEQQRRWAEANRDQMNEASRRWKMANPDKVRAEKRRSMAKRKALKRAATVIPFTAEQLAQRMSMFPGCWIQGEGCTGIYEHTDHVKPLAAGGAHCLSNLRPACRACNVAKNAQWPFGRAS